MRVILVLLTALFPFPSFADGGDIDLFGVFKPVNKENVLEVQARVDGCRVEDMDYLWHMGADSHGNHVTSTKRSKLEGQIRKRFVISRTLPGNSASCQKLSPPSQMCNSISASAAELGWVAHGMKDPSLVIRANQQGGTCDVGAYLDIKGKPVKVNAIQVVADNVVIKQVFGVFTGATFRVKAVVINPDKENISFPCVQDCEKSEP